MAVDGPITPADGSTAAAAVGQIAAADGRTRFMEGDGSIVAAAADGSTAGDNRTTMYSIAYNIPVSLLEAYRGRQLIVRARESSELVNALTEDDLEDLLYVRLLSIDA